MISTGGLDSLALLVRRKGTFSATGLGGTGVEDNEPRNRLKKGYEPAGTEALPSHTCSLTVVR